MGDLLWIGVLAVIHLILKYRADWFNQILATVFGKAIVTFPCANPGGDGP